MMFSRLKIGDLLGLRKYLIEEQGYDDVEITNVPEAQGVMQIKATKEKKNGR